MLFLKARELQFYMLLQLVLCIHHEHKLFRLVPLQLLDHHPGPTSCMKKKISYYLCASVYIWNKMLSGEMEILWQSEIKNLGIYPSSKTMYLHMSVLM